MLRDPWRTAETLFHEGLHLKLFDVLRSDTLAKDPDFLVPIPWRTISWTLERVLAALHVYVHLVLFRAAALTAGADLRARFGSPPAGDEMDRPTPGSIAATSGGYRTRVERARCLAEMVERHADRLTVSGRRFVAWLLDAIEPVVSVRNGGAAPSDPPDEPYDIESSGYRRVEPVVTCPMPDQGLLLVMPQREPWIRWLNATAWTVYALCDGRDATALESSYRQVSGAAADDSQATTLLRTSLRELFTSGLIVPAAG